MNKFISSSKFGDELLFISNLGQDIEGRARATTRPGGGVERFAEGRGRPFSSRVCPSEKAPGSRRARTVSEGPSP